jgi:hypothetical protein
MLLVLVAGGRADLVDTAQSEAPVRCIADHSHQAHEPDAQDQAESRDRRTDDAVQEGKGRIRKDQQDRIAMHPAEAEPGGPEEGARPVQLRAEPRVAIMRHLYQ